MRRMGALLLAALLLAALTGCAPAGAREEDGLKLWFLSAETEQAGGLTELTSWDYTGTESVTGLLGGLLAGPEEESGLYSPIPAETRVLEWALVDQILYVDFTRPYGDLVGIDLTLADYCVTLTLAQLPGVEGVAITVNGSELGYRDRQIFYPEDVVFFVAEGQLEDSGEG